MQLLLQLLMLMLIQFLQQLLLQLLLRDRDCAPLYSFSHCERNPCRPLMDLAKVFAVPMGCTQCLSSLESV